MNSIRSSTAETYRQQQQQLLQQQQQQARQMSSMMHQRPAHSQSHQSLSSSYDSTGRYKIIQEVTPMSHSVQPPFKKTHYPIQTSTQTQTVPCINLNPYAYNEQLMSVLTFNELLFPNLSFDMCVERLSVLKIQLYIGNR